MPKYICIWYGETKLGLSALVKTVEGDKHVYYIETDKTLCTPVFVVDEPQAEYIFKFNVCKLKLITVI